VTASGTAPFSYQWRFNGTALPGATSLALTLSNVQSNKAGSYLVVVTNAAGSVTSAVATLTVYVPAGIATQPSSQTTTQGLNAAFSVVPSGTAPFSYQWSFNSTALSDATNSALALTNVQTTDAGNYTVVVTNSWGSMTSAVATLTVLVPPGITTQPQSQAVVVGQSPTFSVTASGTAPFSYQWRFNGTALPGATSLALTLSNVQSNKAGSYLVVVTNAAGSVTSAVATLAVYVPAGIATQPSSQTTTQGLNAAFSVVPSGTAPFSYQWSFNGTALSDATNSALALTNVQTTDAGSYTVVVTNSWGSVTSAVARLTVLVPAGITTQPQSQAVVVGQSPTFSVTASGTAPFSYQWRFNGTALSGATSLALTLSNVQSNKTGSYLVVVTNAAGSVTSAVATLAVYVPPAITTQPLSQTVTQGLNATFSVVASGTAPFSYQWQFSGTDVAGATNATLVVTNVQLVQAGNYGVTVTNPWGTAASVPAFLTVVLPAGSDLPVMQGLVAHLTFDTDLTDSSGRGNHAAAVGAPNLVPGFIGAGSFNPFTQNGTNNYATFGTPLDLTFNKYTDFTIAFWARLPAGGWNGSAAHSDPAFISNKDWSNGANYGWVVATGSDGRLQWNYTESGGQLRKDYDGPAGAFGNSTWHHVAITFQRTVNAITYFDGVPVSTNSIAPGTKVIDSGLPTNIGNDGTGLYPVSYGYWTNAFGIPANGLAMDDLGIWSRVLPAQQICAIYNVGLAGQDLATVASDDLTVVARPRITQPPVSLEVTAGSNASFSVTASGTAPLTCQWYGNGVSIAGGTGASLTLSNVQPAQAGSYYVVITNGTGSATSAVATLTVDAPPSITAQSPSQAVTLGQNASFSVVASGMAPLSYQWSLNGTALSGATSSALTLANVQTTDAGNYTVVVTNSLGSVTSALATLTVNVTPEITTQPLAQTVTAGQNVSFSIVGTGTAPLNYQWSFNGTALAGASTSALTLANVQTTDAGSYTVVVTNVAGSVTGAVATLTVYVPPAITTQPLSQTVTQGQSASFSVVASGTALLSYQWTRNGTALAGASTSALTLANVQTTDAGSYTVVVANAAGSVTGAVTTLTVLIPPAITTQPQAQTVIVGQSATFSVVATGSAPLGYQWSRNGTAVSGATNSMLTLNTAQSADAGSYTVMVTDVAGSVPSMVATLTVIPPTPPSFDSAGMTPNGFTFQLSVPVGCTYVILATTNLQDWTPISTNVALTGSVVVTDPAATNCSRQFYRAMVQ
jgi:purine nucleoside phosphorylase